MGENSPTGDEVTAQAVTDIEEIITDIGLRGFLTACSQTRAGEYISATSTMHMLRVVLRQISESNDPRLESEIISLAIGMILAPGVNQTRIAEKHGLSRAAISKRVVAFVEKHHIRPSEFMKSEEARKTYALTNRPRVA